ncbi:MAG: MerR family transcriptional regulator [Chloroflexota bacterium]
MQKLTIGQLAKQMGVRTSTLRYYEKEGLITPDGRSESGYRLYKPEATQTIQLIQRAQRVGFSLADIKALLASWESGDLSNQKLIETAEARFLALERQVTKMLVLRRELAHFLQDIHGHETNKHPADTSPFDELIDRVCAHPEEQTSSSFMLDWLMEQHECQLSGEEAQQILGELRGQHVHIWQENETYHILVVSKDDAVGDALQKLVEIEVCCEAHVGFSPEFTHNTEGFLMTADGEYGFLFARLFLALETE